MAIKFGGATPGTSAAAQAKRNLNPHKPARVAMILWNEKYASQGGGSMDFWDRLSESDKKLCRDILQQIEQAPPEKAR